LFTILLENLFTILVPVNQEVPRLQRRRYVLRGEFYIQKGGATYKKEGLHTKRRGYI